MERVNLDLKKKFLREKDSLEVWNWEIAVVCRNSITSVLIYEK